MISAWEGFFEAQIAAAAALTGLVFVAMSINLQPIVEYPGLVGRAAEALLMLIQPVFVGLAVIQAGQTLRAIGVEDLVISAVTSGIVFWILLTSGRVAARGRPRREYAIRATAATGAMLPGLVASVLLIAGSGDGFHVQAVGTGLCIAGGVADAWVLLVEIVR